ncbi:seven-hairpin glycosidase [Dendrothele bispora CBS 962.96]|uniref:alpha-1,2-Mannosidase n=1 Tax=Dendrothele bispora (strain CBS 962.96) TaxID=1314807 RepID=A0A4S8MIF5_DENBC|nr:seven-hairpin glycosidase [Dendrothele bispora CBS 962.96]
MVYLRPSRVVLLGLSLSASSVLGGSIQKNDLSLPADAQTNRDRVKNIFTTSYNAYKDHAFGHDDYTPISKSFTDSRNGWGASIIDAMSTMWVMDLTDDLNEAIDFASKIDFSKSNTQDNVSVFESTIRYIGGLLSTYELTGKKNQALVDKAKQLADKLSQAWVGNSDIPYGHIDFTTNSPARDSSNIAEAGTLTMEWWALSKYTNDQKYTQLAEKSARQPVIDISCMLTGLPGQGIDPSTGNPVGGYVTWGGGSDSYFEYLIKYPRLTNTDDDFWTDMWSTAVDSSIKTLLSVSDVGNHLYLADYDSSRRIRHVGSHLACFYGGNWIMGGKLTNNETIVNYGLELVEGCWNTYSSTATGIGPESFAWKSSGPDGDYTGGSTPSAAQEAFYAQHGFYPTSSFYILRPEVLESNFYAWRATGDTKYLDRAAQAISSFEKYLKVDEGFAGLTNVDDNSANATKVDDMESFWFAEVLKYLYLTFDDPSHVSLDEYVFNTEAHPFQAPSAKEKYGTGVTPSSAPQQPEQSSTPTVSDVGPAATTSPMPSSLGLGGLGIRDAVKLFRKDLW